MRKKVLTLPRAIAAISVVIEELEAQINSQYEGRLHYPSERRRYERDMEAVTDARRALGLLSLIVEE